jgi:hypothetical protein
MTQQSRASGIERFLNRSFANDVYSKEEGERLLLIVGLGASLGSGRWNGRGRSSH